MSKFFVALLSCALAFAAENPGLESYYTTSDITTAVPQTVKHFINAKGYLTIATLVYSVYKVSTLFGIEFEACLACVAGCMALFPVSQTAMNVFIVSIIWISICAFYGDGYNYALAGPTIYTAIMSLVEHCRRSASLNNGAFIPIIFAFVFAINVSFMNRA